MACSCAFSSDNLAVSASASRSAARGVALPPTPNTVAASYLVSPRSSVEGTVDGDGEGECPGDPAPLPPPPPPRPATRSRWTLRGVAVEARARRAPPPPPFPPPPPPLLVGSPHSRCRCNRRPRRSIRHVMSLTSLRGVAAVVVVGAGDARRWGLGLGVNSPLLGMSRMSRASAVLGVDDTTRADATADAAVDAAADADAVAAATTPYCVPCAPCEPCVAPSEKRSAAAGDT